MAQVRGRVMSFVNFLIYLDTVKKDVVGVTVVDAKDLDSDIIVNLRVDYTAKGYEVKRFRVSYKLMLLWCSFFGLFIKPKSNYLGYSGMLHQYNKMFDMTLMRGFVGVLVPRSKKYRLDELVECSEIPMLEQQGFRFTGDIFYLDAVPSKKEGYHDVAFITNYASGDTVGSFMLWVTVCTRGLQEHEIENSAVVVSTFEEVERYLEG